MAAMFWQQEYEDMDKFKEELGQRKASNDPEQKRLAEELENLLDAEDHDFDEAVAADDFMTMFVSAEEQLRRRNENKVLNASLEKIAQTVVTDARTLTVTVFDPELVGAVDKAIRGAGLDLNPQIAGSTLRVPIPKVTQEGRKKLTKQAGSIAENAKVVIRRIRHHYMDTGKKLDLPKDDAKKYEKDVQEIHDKAVKDIDARVKTKQAQLLDD